MESQRKNPEKKKKQTKPNLIEKRSNLWLPDTLRGNGVGRGEGVLGVEVGWGLEKNVQKMQTFS